MPGLRQQLVLDPRWKVTSSGRGHLHMTASRARHRRIVIFSPHAPLTGIQSLNLKLQSLLISCLHWIQYTDVRLLSDTVHVLESVIRTNGVKEFSL